MPFIVHWPERVKAATSPALVSQIDMTATLARLVGAKNIADIPADSRDQLSVWLGKDQKGREYVIGAGASLTVLTPEWKYIEPSQALPYNVLTNTELGNHPEEQLYHIATDRGEYDNIAKEKPEIVGEMKTILEKEKSKGVGMEL